MDQLVGAIGSGLLIVILIYSGCSNSSAALSAKALNPYILLACIIMLYCTDFYIAFAKLDNDGTVGISSYYLSDFDDIAAGFRVFGIINAGFATGLLASQLIWPSPRVARSKNSRRSLATDAAVNINRAVSIALSSCFIILGCIVTIIIARQAIALGSIFGITAIRQTYLKDNPLFLICLGLLPASTAFLFRYNAPWSREVLVALVVALTASTIALGRTAIFSILVLWMFAAFAHRRGPRALWLFLFLPAALSTHIGLQYLQRDSQLFASFSDALVARQGVFGYLFEGEQVAMARPLSIIVQEPALRLVPFTGIAAAITLPIPRSIAPWKLVGPSTSFTQYIDSDRWNRYGSEIVVSGYGNLYMEFGPLSFFPAVALACLWDFAFRSELRLDLNLRQRSSVGLLFLFAFIFIRNDFLILGMAFWPYIIYWIIFKLSVEYRLSRINSRIG